jgi:hypothetical protein
MPSPSRNYKCCNGRQNPAVLESLNICKVLNNLLFGIENLFSI